MRLRNLLFLYTRRIRTHPLQELLALLGIAVGVALVFAVQVANTSVAGSVEELVRGVTGSATLQVTARGPYGINAGIVPAIARLPGVRTAAPVLEVRANVRGPRGVRGVTLLGGDLRLASLDGRLMRAFASRNLRLDSAVALPEPVADAIGTRVDGRVLITAGAEPVRGPVAIVLGGDQIGPLVNSPVMLAPLAYVQGIAGLRGRVSRVLIASQPGAEASVRAALMRLVDDHANVGTSDMETRLVRQATQPNDQSTALFAAISGVVGLLFAFNAMLLTVPERRRFIADLRVEGLGDATVVKLVVFDALVLGVAASLAGLLLGDQLSRHVFHAAPGYLSFAFTIGGQRIVDSQSVLLAFGGGLLATMLAALRPLDDLVARRPLDAVYRTDEREEDVVLSPRWLLGGGIALVGAAAAVLVFAPAAMIFGIALLVGGMLLLTPRILAAVLGVVDRLAHRVRSAILLVSIGELRASTTRSLALALTGALAVFGSVAVEGSHLDLQRGLDRDAHHLNAQADLWVGPAGNENTLATTAFHAPMSSRVLAVPGVAAVRAYRGAFLDVGDRRVWVLAPPSADRSPIFASQVVEGGVAEATRRLRGGGWVAISQAIAEDRHLHVGDRVTLPTAVPTRLRLAAVLTNLGWTSGAIVLNAADFQRAWGSDAVSALQVLLEPGASPEAAARRVQAVIGPGAGLTVLTAAQREARFRALSRQGLSRLTQIATLVLVAAALALAAAMGGVVWSRRPRLATLKLSGFTDGEVWRALVLESAIILGIGCSTGALFGLGGQFMLTRWLQHSTGFPTSYSTAGWLALTTFVGVSLVAVGIAALPGWIAARMPPTTSFQEP
jgi:putative ABC transport system permease protein